MELPKGFATTAFFGEAKKSSEDESTVHHPYFLEQVDTLVKDALDVKCTFGSSQDLAPGARQSC